MGGTNGCTAHSRPRPLGPRAASLCAQQRRFNAFRTEFNTERPHEALGGAAQASVFQPSTRPCPARLVAPEYPEHFTTRYVSTNGGMRFHNHYVTLAPALIGEHIELDEIADGVWAVYFYDYLLGHLNEREGHVQGVHVRTKTSR